MNIESRIERLERTNRRLRHWLTGLSALLCIAVLGAAARDDGKFRYVVAEKIAVGDITKEGSPIVVIDGTSPDYATISLQRVAKQGEKTFMSFQLGPKMPLLTIQDPESDSVVMLSANGATAGLAATSPDGKQQLKLQVDNTGVKGPK